MTSFRQKQRHPKITWKPGNTHTRPKRRRTAIPFADRGPKRAIEDAFSLGGREPLIRGSAGFTTLNRFRSRTQNRFRFNRRRTHQRPTSREHKGITHHRRRPTSDGTTTLPRGTATPAAARTPRPAMHVGRPAMRAGRTRAVRVPAMGNPMSLRGYLTRRMPSRPRSSRRNCQTDTRRGRHDTQHQARHQQPHTAHSAPDLAVDLLAGDAGNVCLRDSESDVYPRFGDLSVTSGEKNGDTVSHSAGVTRASSMSLELGL